MPAVLSRLLAIDDPAIEARLPSGRSLLLGEPGAGRMLTLRIHRWRALLRALLLGDVGVARSYAGGEWDSDALAELIRMGLRSDRLARLLGTARLPARLWYALKHRLRRNSVAGSRRNIHAHYDLGNSFYALWLDPSMTYSSGIFASDEDDLEAAQQRKYARILEAIGARPGLRVLEIGCGWGGFAEAAARAGCEVRAITISKAQHAFATKRIAEAGLDGLATVELCDYREVEGSYDAIVSIEMIEAVGEAYWPAYFTKIASCLVPGGRALIQAITIDESLFAEYRRGSDCIRELIFPGGMLPAPSALRAQAVAAQLAVEESFTFGQDYAETLRLWHARFLAEQEEVAKLGYGPAFMRQWRFYLAACEAAFRAGRIDVGHYKLVKPACVPAADEAS